MGQILLGLSLAVAAYTAFAAYRGARTRDPRWIESSRRGTLAQALMLGGALLLLLVAFLTDRFALRYVAQHSATFIPVYLKVSAVWAGQEGSLLLWAALQACFTAWAVIRPPAAARRWVPWATVFLSLITAFFVGVTLFLSSPFAQLPQVPLEGQGLNPLLRHPGMVFHPPALYVGYVGLAVPFAFAMAALASGQLEGWTAALRNWVLVAWLGLGLGLLLGMRWAYDVLGWGGYWGWDPVENAGLLPWFTTTALLHGSVMQQEKRGYRVWNLLLAIVSFVLVLFGTFATRSGVIASVHAYARSNLGGTFLAAIGVTVVGAAALLIARRRLLASGDGFERLLSRDGMFFLTLVLFSTLTVSVFVGTTLPTITETLTGRRFEAGPAWFDRVTGPQFAALVLVMGICPLLGRAAASLARLRSRAWGVVAGALVVPGLAAFSGFTQPVSLLGFGVVGFAGAATVAEMVAGTVARRARSGEAPLNAFWTLLRTRRRTYGGYMVHVGVILMALGIIGTRLYPLEEELPLQLNQPTEAGRYTLVYEGLQQDRGADHLETRALVSVYRDATFLAMLEPQVTRYAITDQPVTVPAVRPSVREDLYLSLAGWSESGDLATIKMVVNPLVAFLWLGGLVFLAGGALALWPRLREPGLNALALGAGLLLLVGAGWAMWGIPHGVVGGTGGRPLVGQPAPDFRLPLLDETTFSLAAHEGEVVVVNFWSPGCPPCRDEMPDLQATWEAVADRGVVFVGVADQAERAPVEEALLEFGTTYPVGLDAGSRVSDLYGITGVPETFVIDAAGRVANVYVGPVTAETLEGALRPLLEASGE